jgi:hypothetical protein
MPQGASEPDVDTASSVGKVIFDKAVTAMTPLDGAIIGYLFASRKNGAQVQ